MDLDGVVLRTMQTPVFSKLICDFSFLRDLCPKLYCSARQNVSTVIVANGKKVDINKQGLNSVQNKTVKLNLMGKSESMKAKDWVDPSGRKGKVRFFRNIVMRAYTFSILE
jgi:hypothetical protein